MPVWFQNQLKRAFYQKDCSQIQLLNQCWFYYIQFIKEKQANISLNVSN